MFGDAIFSGRDIGLSEIRELVAVAPEAGRAVLELYGAYSRVRDDRAALFERLDGGDRGSASASASRLASEEITDFVQAQGNYFPLLEEAAERLWRDAKLEYGDVYSGLVRHLHESFGVRVKIVPFTESRNTVRRYDESDHTVLLSEVLPPTSRNFQLANQIGLLQFRATIDSYLEGVRFANPDTPAFARIALANYFAGAVLMPYESFLDAAKTARHDVDILENRFGVSFEQVCHRLTTLQRPGARGVPLHFVRVDIAGNISKRFSASAIQISRQGGACPRWNVYDAFMSPGLIRTQYQKHRIARPISALPGPSKSKVAVIGSNRAFWRLGWAVGSKMPAHSSMQTASISKTWTRPFGSASTAVSVSAWIVGRAHFRRSITASTSTRTFAVTPPT